ESEQQTTQPSSSASSEYCLPGDVSPCEPPIGEWRFEEGAGSEVADSSGNNNHGVWSGTGQKYEKGKLGKAGYFNGVDDVVIIPNSATLNPTTELTISAWINLAHLNSQHLIRKASSYAITK